MRRRRVIKRIEAGLALPLTLLMILTLTAASAVMVSVSRENLGRLKLRKEASQTYLVAEGAANQILGDMAIYGALWDQLPNLASKPYGYTEYAPGAYSATNGIPTCTGESCLRNLYPLGGGLLKNLGPLTGAGATVDTNYAMADQLNYTSPQTADSTLGNLSGWSQVERLDETTPNASSVGGSLSNSLAEGGNARTVRFRVTGLSMKRVRGRVGLASVVMVVELPFS